MTREAQDSIQYPKTLLIAIEAPYNHSLDIRSYFEEFINLVKTNEIIYEDIVEVRLRSIDAGTFLTKGHLESIANLCNEKNIEEVIISEPLTALQERNLSNVFKAKVFDRTQLILEIFEKTALTAEGKIQVAIAMLQHQKSRVSGKGIHLAQQRGVRGMRSGAGETAKERELRNIDENILKYRRQLESFQQIRATQRKKRLELQVPHICLIGYTNAGKSTILNTLTKSNVLAADRPFVTLDTTTRELYINHEKKGIISDTVGFIQKLPHRLVEAFKSTLNELSYADLLLHVVDISDKNWVSHIEVVHHILRELNVNSPMLYVFNKADRLASSEEITVNLEQYEPYILTSARTREELEPLITFLSTWHKPHKKESDKEMA